MREPAEQDRARSRSRIDGLPRRYAGLRNQGFAEPQLAIPYNCKPLGSQEFDQGAEVVLVGGLERGDIGRTRLIG
jgi:hypothetical protein